MYTPARIKDGLLRRWGWFKIRATGVALSRLDPGTLVFDCCVCGRRVKAAPQTMVREAHSCPVCNSTVRFRSITWALSNALYGRDLAVDAFPVDRSIVGIGMSDWEGYADRLAEHFDYTNTFVHQEPFLDVTDVGPEWEGRADFVISSDVFEHVRPPAADAFLGMRKLLRPGGIAVFTVPYEGDETVEHYPELHDFEIVERGAGEYVVVNRTKDGRTQEFANPVFHGGQGFVLEMRLFGLADIVRQLEAAGFGDIKVHSENVLDVGVLWHDGDAVPITARAI